MSNRAGTCAQVPLMVACIAPFLAGPRAQIGYSLGGRSVSQNLALPIVAPKFCTPPDAPVAKEAFFQRWRAVEGAPIDALFLCLAWRAFGDPLSKLHVDQCLCDMSKETKVAWILAADWKIKQ